MSAPTKRKGDAMGARWSRRVALACTAAVALGAAGCGGEDQLGGTLRTDRAALDEPVVKAWARALRAEEGVALRRGSASGADVRVSDGAPAPADGEVAIPVADVPVAIAYHLTRQPPISTTVRSGLKLDGPILVGTWRGKLFNWHQKIFLAANPKLQIPDELILVCHRDDPSGTTVALSRWFSEVREVWRRNRGTEAVMRTTERRIWERLRGAAALARCVDRQEGTVAHVPLPFARERELTVAAVESRAGRFVLPTAADYPIRTTLSVVVPRELCADGRDAQHAERVKALLDHALGEGQRAAAGLGYGRLAPEAAERARRQVGALRCDGEPLGAT